MAVTLDPNALATLDDVKDFLGIPLTIIDRDDFLKKLINRALGLFEHETSRKLKERAYVNKPEEVMSDGSALDVIFLRQRPVKSVQLLNLGFGSADVDPSEFKVYRDGWIRLQVRIIEHVSPQVVPEGIQNVRVDYTAGYAVTDPEFGLLELATWDQVAHLYRRSGRGDSRAGLESRSHGDKSENFIDDAIMAPGVMMVLEKFTSQDWIPHRQSPGDSFVKQ